MDTDHTDVAICQDVSLLSSFPPSFPPSLLSQYRLLCVKQNFHKVQRTKTEEGRSRNGKRRGKEIEKRRERRRRGKERN